MGRNPSLSQIDEAAAATAAATTTSSSTTSTSSATDGVPNAGNGSSSSNNNNNDQGLHLIRDRLRFKRNPIGTSTATSNNQDRAAKSSVDRTSLRSRLHHTPNRNNRKGFLFWFPFRGAYLLYFVIFFAVFAFAMASMVLQSSITEIVFSEHRRSIREGLRLGSTLKFLPGRKSMGLAEGRGLDQARLQGRMGLRSPTLALVSVLILFPRFEFIDGNF